MLHQIVEYATSHGIAGEAGFTPKIVRWLITFNPKGEYLGVVDLTGGDRNSKGKEFPRSPHLKFSGDTPMRQFLVDTAKFVVLLGEKPPENDAAGSEKKAWQKLLAKREYFLNLLRAGGEADSFLAVVADRLEDDAVRERILGELDKQTPKAKPTDNATFAEVAPDGIRTIVEHDHWHDWWRDYFPTLFSAKRGKGNDEAKKKSKKAFMRCFLSGKLESPSLTHPKIRGLTDVGGNAEATLIGFNEPAFCSYGLTQSANSSMSDAMCQQYAAGLNDLITRHSQRLAGAKVLYWYTGEIDEGAGEDPLAAFFNPSGFPLEPEDVDSNGELNPLGIERREYDALKRARELLDAIRSGSLPKLRNSRYCALTLSGNKARISVEDWMEGQFESLVESVVKWFDHLQIVNIRGNSIVAPPPFERIVTCLLSERKPDQKYENWVKPVKPWRKALWRCALTTITASKSRDDQGSESESHLNGIGLPIPDIIARRAVQEMQRSVVNGEVLAALTADGERRPLRLATLYARMAVLRAWLFRKNIQQGDLAVEPILKPDHPSPVYQFGRLVAVLADLQLQALRKEGGQNVKSSLVDRFYTAASTTPRLMHGRLTALSNHHLRKLEQTESGRIAANAIRRRIAEINGRIDDAKLPNAALLEDQTLFALGYYQQIAHMNWVRARAAEKKKAARS